MPAKGAAEARLATGELSIFDRSKHFRGYHAFRCGVQDGALELMARIGTMFLAVRDDSREGDPDSARAAIHGTAAIAESRRNRQRAGGRTQPLPDILKSLDQSFGYTPRRVRPTGVDGRRCSAVLN